MNGMGKNSRAKVLNQLRQLTDGGIRLDRIQVVVIIRGIGVAGIPDRTDSGIESTQDIRAQGVPDHDGFIRAGLEVL